MISRWSSTSPRCVTVPRQSVFYVQYAHARAASVLRHADGVPTEAAARVAWLTAADKRHDRIGGLL